MKPSLSNKWTASYMFDIVLNIVMHSTCNTVINVSRDFKPQLSQVCKHRLKQFGENARCWTKDLQRASGLVVFIYPDKSEKFSVSLSYPDGTKGMLEINGSKIASRSHHEYGITNCFHFEMFLLQIWSQVFQIENDTFECHFFSPQWYYLNKNCHAHNAHKVQ